jgi:hypothetical protein
MSSKRVDDRLLLWIDQPTPNGTNDSVATIDAEPWVIFAEASNRVQADGKRNSDLAKEFLRIFYQKENYLQFTSAVPVHLTPIFKQLANDKKYVDAASNFGSWHQRTIERLQNGSTRPILMPDANGRDRELPFLLEFQRVGILSGAVSDVLSSGKTPVQAAKRAQMRAVQVVNRSGSGVKCR